MADIEALKRQIRDNIRSNGRQDISGDMLQTYMIGILDAFPQNEIKTVTFSELDGLNNSYNTGIYKVSTNGGIVECGKLWVIANWGGTVTFQVLLSPTTAEDLNTANGLLPAQQANAMYLCMRYYSKSAGAWSRWEDMIDKGVLRTVNIADIDNLGHSTGDFGSYDIQGGMASLFYLNSVMYYSQLVTGVVYLTDEGKLMLGGTGKINMFHRKRKYNSDWESWEEYKPEIDTTPFVKTVEWKGITVKNVNVLQASASVPGEVVLLVNDDNNGISFVYEVMSGDFIPTYYGNWRGREYYQTGVYTPNTIGFSAGFFDNTLYVAPNSIWMVNEELRLVNKSSTSDKIEVVDNLASTSTTAALSAAQGKALDEKKADRTELSEYAYAPNMPWELIDPNTLGIEQVDDAGNIAIFWKQKDLDGKEKENALNLPVATTALNGIMSAADKSKLDGLPASVYSKGETDKRLALKANNADVYTKAQADAAINSKLVGVYKPQGNKVQFSDLTTADQVAGYVFNILTPFTLDGEEYPAGSNVVWTAEDELRPAHWDVLGGFIDLTPYAKVANLPSKIIEADTVMFDGDADSAVLVFAQKSADSGAVEEGRFHNLPVASTTKAGIMTSADKTKLDGMSAKITELEAEIEELKKAIAAK